MYCLFGFIFYTSVKDEFLFRKSVQTIKLNYMYLFVCFVFFVVRVAMAVKL